MRYICIHACLFLMVLFPGSARAASADAREIARLNNCPPKKVEVYQQQVGPNAPTIYQVSCNAPKAVDEKGAKMATALLIKCDGSLCDMLRPLYDDVK